MEAIMVNPTFFSIFVLVIIILSLINIFAICKFAIMAYEYHIYTKRRNEEESLLESDMNGLREEYENIISYISKLRGGDKDV